MNTIIDNCYHDAASEIELLPVEKRLHSYSGLPGSGLPEVMNWAKLIHSQHNSESADVYADDLSMCLVAVRIKHSRFKQTKAVTFA